MKRDAALYLGAAIAIGVILLATRKKVEAEPAIGFVPMVSPPIRPGMENIGFTGNPISASRPNEIFGAPQPPISMSRAGDALIEQGLRYATDRAANALKGALGL